MVFSSPIYLDPPNWQQQQPNHDHHQLQNQSVGRSSTDHNRNPHIHPPPQPQAQSGGSGTSSVKPGSMAERARLAKIQQPETALKCPRCDSTNTKFCYFNNYSLTQPRHFCKTCRRYWTRGGALRSVPVGGGCRRNKRTKPSSKSKSPANSDHQLGVSASSNSAAAADMFGHLPPPPPQMLPHLPFLPSLHYGGSGDLGLNFAGIPMPGQGSSGGSDVEFLSAEQWRIQQQVQQFPFLGTLENPINTNSSTGSVLLYPNFDNQSDGLSYAPSNKPLDSSSVVTSGLVSQMSAVKVEGNNGDNNNNNNNQGLNLSRNFLGSLGNSLEHHPYNLGGNSSGNAWGDLSSFSTCSTSHNII